MDTWMGINKQPITLNKYLYAHADPVKYTDPSGYSVLAFNPGLSLSIGSTLSSAASFSILQTARGLITRVVGTSLFKKIAVTSAIIAVANEAGDEVGDVGRAVSKGIAAFNDWTKSSQYQRSQDRGHYVTTQGSSGLTRSPTVSSPEKTIPGTHIKWTHKSGGLPGRVLGFEYKLGRNGNAGRGTAFTFRIDYQDYVTTGPPGIFRPHYHLCMLGVDCSRHYYFDEVFR